MTIDIRRSRITRWDASLIVTSMGIAALASGIASALGLSADVASTTGVVVALGAFGGLVSETGLSYVLIRVARRLVEENEKRVDELDRIVRRLLVPPIPEPQEQDGVSGRFRIVLYISTCLMIAGFLLWMIAGVALVQSLSSAITGVAVWNVSLWLAIPLAVLAVVMQCAFLLPALDVRVRLLMVARVIDALDNGAVPVGLRRTSAELRSAERRPRARPFGPFRFPTWRGGLPAT